LKLIAITGLAGGTYPLLSIMDRGFRREEVGVSAEEFGILSTFGRAVRTIKECQDEEKKEKVKRDTGTGT